MSWGTTLILGWGNPGRLDDGLGPAFADAVRVMSLPGIQVETDYQLQVEDTAELARHRRVLFVDADRCGEAPFHLQRIAAGDHPASFSTHSVAPEGLLALARHLFDAAPEAWLLGIRGYEFEDFGEGLSAAAEKNLSEALRFFREAFSQGELWADRASDEGLPDPHPDRR